MNTAPDPAEAAEAVAEKVRGVLAGRTTLFLSTAAHDAPWAAGTFFAEAGLFELRIVLETRGTTLANLRANPRVAVVVSSGSPFELFLQGEGTAAELTDPGEVEATTAALLAKAPEVAPFLRAPLAAVALRLRRWRATDVPNGWFPGKELLAEDLPSRGPRRPSPSSRCNPSRLRLRPRGRIWEPWRPAWPQRPARPLARPGTCSSPGRSPTSPAPASDRPAPCWTRHRREPPPDGPCRWVRRPAGGWRRPRPGTRVGRRASRRGGARQPEGLPDAGDGG